MSHRSPVAPSKVRYDVLYSPQRQPSHHLSHQGGGLHQPRGAWILGTPENGFGPSGPFFELRRTNGALASLRMRNAALLSVIRELGLQPSTACSCSNRCQCQPAHEGHHHDHQAHHHHRQE